MFSVPFEAVWHCPSALGSKFAGNGGGLELLAPGDLAEPPGHPLGAARVCRSTNGGPCHLHLFCRGQRRGHKNAQGTNATCLGT